MARKRVSVIDLREGMEVIIDFPPGQAHSWRLLNVIPVTKDWVNIALILPGRAREYFGTMTMSLFNEDEVEIVY